MRLYFIRHADPDYSTDTLTPRGKREAEALSDYLGTLNLDRMYTSPMGRARETASYTSAKTGIPSVVLDWTAELRLRSCDGTDYPAWETIPENLRRPEFQEHSSWTPALEQLARDSDAWIESLGWRRDGFSYVYRPESGVPKKLKVALFGHGGFGLSWLSHLLAIPTHLLWSSFFLQTSSVTTVLFEERVDSKATPRILSMSQLPHIYKAGLEPSTTGMKWNHD